MIALPFSLASAARGHGRRGQMAATLRRGAALTLFAVASARAASTQTIVLTPSPAVMDQNTEVTITATVNGNAPYCAAPPAQPTLQQPACNWTFSLTSPGVVGPVSASTGSASATIFSQLVAGTGTLTVSRYGVPAAASVQVTVRPLTIDLSGPQQIPQTESAILTATLSGLSGTAPPLAVNWLLSGGGTEVPNTGCPSCPQQTTAFTAGTTAGAYTLTAQSVAEPSVSASMTLTVLPPPVETITPPTAAVAPGQTFNFNSTTLYSSNQAAFWTTDDADGFVNAVGDGSIGSFYHYPGKPGGQFHVTAIGEALGAPQAAAVITVVSLSLAPSAVVVPPGTSRQFLAELTGSQQPLQWSTSIPGASISGAGLLSVPNGTAAGSYSVTAQTAGNPVATASASVTVAGSVPVTGVTVSPTRSILDSGQQEPFTAVVQGQNGEPDPNQAVSWSVAGPAPAAIAAGGLFNAPAVPGIYTVTAVSQADGTKSGTAIVTVGEDLMVLPSSAGLAPGAGRGFQAQVSGMANPTVSWSVEEGTAGGTITAAGLYTAPPAPGVYHVIALASAGGDTVRGLATVTVSADPEISVTLSPAESQMVRGAMQLFTATVQGTANTAVSWSASAGAIDASGLFTAPAAVGTVTITATSLADGRTAASATVTVTDGGQGQPFQYDANGNLLADGSRTYEWDAENRLTAINIGSHRSEFAYDGLGRRALVTEKDSGTVTSSVHDVWVGDQLAEETDATAAPAGNPPATGSFDTGDCNQLAGWAWNPAQPDTPISVDLYAGATRVATVLANTYRADLKQAGVGNGNHSFFYPTPAALMTGTAQTVTLKVGGTATVVGTRSVTCQTPVLGGFFDSIDCNQLAGWAWDRNQPNAPIAVDIYDGTTLIATVLAGNFRQDLLNAGYGNGYHGFTLPNPPALKTGTSHTVTVQAGGTSTVITAYGNPSRVVSCPAPAFGGFFDSADCDQLVGWAWDANQPNAAISVDIYDGGTLVATVPAGTFRQDLLNAGKGNGAHGFTYTSPSLYSGTSHDLSVNYAGTARALTESPRSFTCPIEPVLTRFFPAGMRAGSTNYYFSYDHLGSVREVTDASGNVVSRYDYDPYGRLTVNQGVPPRFGFAGYYYHSPSGLSLTKFRAYDPDLGRWASREPADEAASVSPYSYSMENPIGLFDPDGRTPIALPPAPFPSGWGPTLPSGEPEIGPNGLPPGLEGPPFRPDLPFRWAPDPRDSRGGKWYQPGLPGAKASWDKEPTGPPSGGSKPGIPHWDKDDGKGNRTRCDKNGKPVSDAQVHPKMAPLPRPLRGTLPVFPIPSTVPLTAPTVPSLPSWFLPWFFPELFPG